VLVPEEWHDAADRALAIVRGLVQLGTAAPDVKKYFDGVLAGIAFRQDQLDLFDDIFQRGEVAKTAS
jgi:hypothetical protein